MVILPYGISRCLALPVVVDDVHHRPRAGARRGEARRILPYGYMTISYVDSFGKFHLQ